MYLDDRDPFMQKSDFGQNVSFCAKVTISGEMLNKFKCRGFRATSLSTYDFSTLYTTLPHNLIEEKLLDLIEWTFKRALKTMVDFIWHVMTERLFFFHFL